MPLFVKKLDKRAIAPTCSHPGEDLGYDLYALEDTLLLPHVVNKVRTGIATEHRRATREFIEDYRGAKFYKHVTDGLLLRDRSSMAAKGITIVGGVIDAGYRGEIIVLMVDRAVGVQRIAAGDKIAQMIPIPVLTNEDVVTVEELSDGARGANGFGSTGR